MCKLNTREFLNGTVCSDLRNLYAAVRVHPDAMRIDREGEAGPCQHLDHAGHLLSRPPGPLGASSIGSRQPIGGMVKAEAREQCVGIPTHSGKSGSWVFAQEPRFHALGGWYPCPDSNRGPRFRKPLLYPPELQGQGIPDAVYQKQVPHNMWACLF